MLRAYEYLAAGTWDSARQVDVVLLDFDQRHRRRIVLATLQGNELLIDLPRAMRLREGDGLRLEDGGVVRVASKPEALLEIHAHDDHTSAEGTLVRIAWHLGNRHLPVQLLEGCIRIRADHVIADMIHGLGGHARAIHAPFDPEAGAYAGGHHHHHSDDEDPVGHGHSHG
jgi:urease accessory protein